MDWLNEWSQESSLLGLFLSAFISSTIAPGGSELVLAYMVRTAAHPLWQLILIASIGNTLGALTTWQLGSWTAGRFPLNSAVMVKHASAFRWVRRFGPLALLFSWLPLIGDGFCGRLAETSLFYKHHSHRCWESRSLLGHCSHNRQPLNV